MTLKDAFRYNNYLATLEENVSGYFTKREYLTRTETHQRSKANPQAEDEVVVIPKTIDVPAAKVLTFIGALIDEKARLTAAIAEAKKTVPTDLDSLTTTNSMRRRLMLLIAPAFKARRTETTSKGTDYTFNAEGNQVSYQYDVLTVSEPDVDPAFVRQLFKELRVKADKDSSLAERLTLETNVEFTPLWDFDDTFEEAVAKAN